MIRRVFRYRLNLRQFLKEVPSFTSEWLKTRHWRKIAISLPAVLFSLFLMVVFVRSRLGVDRASLAESYQHLALEAVDADFMKEADIYLARAIELSEDQKAKSLEIATLLYDRGHQSRALEILSSLAPLKHRGYLPAHQFLAKHWRVQQPATDVSMAVAMYHEMHANGDDEGPRLRLARFLSDQGVQRNRVAYQDHAAVCITNLLSPSPEARLQLVSIYARSEKFRAAQSQAELAESALRKLLTANPDDVESRVLLSKSVACQGRILDAVFILADGCQRNPSDKIVDQLIHSYVVWLSTMEQQKMGRQLTELAMVLDPESARDSANRQSSLAFSNGEIVSLPEPMVQLHDRLLLGEGSWIIPVLRAGSLAASKEYPQAVSELRAALKLRPGHPVIGNNLAWVLLKEHQRLSKLLLVNADDPELQVARELSEAAVTQFPQQPEFLETRGQLASVFGDWEKAVADLQACLSLGHDTAAIRETLAKARKNVL